MFVFTNARRRFYKPGETSQILRILLKAIYEKTRVQVPFDQTNTFMIDNEAFRFLAACKQGNTSLMDDKKSYEESWNRSVKEIHRLIQRILQCDLHAVRDTQSLNEAQQLIRQLSRPIAETSRLIHENISLATQYKQNIVNGQSTNTTNGIPQKVGRFVQLQKRLTVCVSPSCTRLIQINDEVVVDYYKHCHDGCFLEDVRRECIGHPLLKRCAAMTSDGEEFNNFEQSQ